jgi:hypothetical protein
MPRGQAQFGVRDTTAQTVTIAATVNGEAVTMTATATFLAGVPNGDTSTVTGVARSSGCGWFDGLDHHGDAHRLLREPRGRQGDHTHSSQRKLSGHPSPR